MSFGCERSCSSPRRVSNFNSKVPQECSRRQGLPGGRPTLIVGYPTNVGYPTFVG